jgi:hypothetical protein
MELVTMNNHEPPMHLSFHLLRYCVDKSTSSRSPACTGDWESRSLEPSSLTILHRGGQIRFLESDLYDCSICFIKLFITTHLPLRRSHVEHCHIYHEFCQSMRGLQESTVEKVTYLLNSQIIFCILNMLICVGMILLDNLL